MKASSIIGLSLVSLAIIWGFVQYGFHTVSTPTVGRGFPEFATAKIKEEVTEESDYIAFSHVGELRVPALGYSILIYTPAILTLTGGYLLGRAKYN